MINANLTMGNLVAIVDEQSKAYLAEVVKKHDQGSRWHVKTPGPASLCLMLCRFLDAGKKEAPHAQLTGVQKAPRHEVAGGTAPAE